jgi:hypothetical protein
MIVEEASFNPNVIEMLLKLKRNLTNFVNYRGQEEYLKYFMTKVISKYS